MRTARFVHKLVVAPMRLTIEKREKDLEQCAALIPILDDERVRRVMQAQRFSKASKQSIDKSYDTVLSRPLRDGPKKAIAVGVAPLEWLIFGACQTK